MSPKASFANSASDLRKESLSQLCALSLEERAKASEQICKYLSLWLSEQGIRRLAAFWPLKSEPEISEALLPFAAGVGGRELLLPRMKGEEMEFFPIDNPKCDLSRSSLGFFQPNGKRSTATQTPEAMLIPGVLFGREGERIGRGGGYYDRYLNRHRNRLRDLPLIGVCFQQQISEQPLPQEPHDRSVRWLLSEVGLWEVGRYPR